MANPLAPVTLTAATVATFTLDGDYNSVEVLNGDGAAEVFFRVDGVNPTVNGANCFYLPAAIGSLAVDLNTTTAQTPTVKAISSGTPKVSVRGIN